MHGFANSEQPYLCLQLTLLHLVFCSFFLYQSPSSSLCTVCKAVSSNTGQVSSTNPSANIYVNGDFNANHQDWLTNSDATDRLINSYDFSNNLTQMVNFPTQIPNCGFHSLELLVLFLSHDASICFGLAFFPLGNFHHVVFSFH